MDWPYIIQDQRAWVHWKNKPVFFWFATRVCDTILLLDKYHRNWIIKKYMFFHPSSYSLSPCPPLGRGGMDSVQNVNYKNSFWNFFCFDWRWLQLRFKLNHLLSAWHNLSIFTVTLVKIFYWAFKNYFDSNSKGSKLA